MQTLRLEAMDGDDELSRLRVVGEEGFGSKKYVEKVIDGSFTSDCIKYDMIHYLLYFRMLQRAEDDRTLSKHFKYEAANMAKKIDLLEASKQKLLGESLGSCSIEELQQTEDQLEQSLSNIRARKNQLYKEKIELLKEKERILAEENSMLCEKCGVQPRPELTHRREIVPYSPSSPISDVETELFIGPPERGTTRLLRRS
ncbi:hypothetical protein HHK36_027863 [Tetracentron sinense]|uniref:K-box domain-containing protein n=1 Tax=Tetracentron sinense TaxID=13715 RepID=A0A834YDV0_TETSI|nr:hypothetical protein HHK36_027863 [Tetracentron sinense]